MELYFARHGQSENNILSEDARSQRSEDPQLTPTGRQQARYLAHFISASRPSAEGRNGRDPHNRSGFGLTHLYSSLMVRAVATGMAVAEAANLPLYAWEDLHEEGGIFLEDPETGELVGQPGRPRGYFTQSYPRFVLPQRMKASGWWNRPFESEEQRDLRARRLLRELLKKHPPESSDRVLVVSHAGFYNRFMHAVLDLAVQKISRIGANSAPWFELQNAALTRMDFWPEHPVIVYCNRTDYLPAELIT